MAIICQNKYGWLVDHREAIDRIYARTVVEGGQPCHGDSILLQKSSLPCQKFIFKESLFNIQHPIVMDSQFYALKMAQKTAPHVNTSESVSSNTTEKPRKRKKKRKSELNIGEVKALDYHNTVRDFLLTAYNSLTDKSCVHGYFASPIDMADGDNNAEARMIAKELDDDNLQELCYTASNTPNTEQRKQKLCVDDLESVGSRIVNHLIMHPSKQARVVTAAASQYILPPECSFLLSDYTQLLTCPELGKYDLIVLDPPWQNKSAKRKKSYNTLCNEDLLELPLPALAADRCLVVVWVTNRWQHIQFIKELLFPHWFVQHVADWHWIKVTKSGQMVYDFDSNHKKPYEVIILGRYKLQKSYETKDSVTKHGSEMRHSRQTSAAEALHESSDSVIFAKDKVYENKVLSDETTEETGDEYCSGGGSLPTQKVVVSIPSSLHSMKPSLAEILKPYTPSDPRCLELFARNLWPGWTSWGNQVLKHQHIKYFDSVT